VDRVTARHTNESRLPVKTGEEFTARKTIIHARNQYVGPDGETPNHVEIYFSLFERGMRGVYQHGKEKHLQRYLNGFVLRCKIRDIDEVERRDKALAGAEGKRLTYRRTPKRAHI